MSELQHEMSAADLVIERMKKDPAIQMVVSDVRLFEGLKEHQGWRRLFEILVKDKKRITDELAARLMKGERIKQEEVEFYRGFYLGAVFILMHPEVAEENLEKAAKIASIIAWRESNEEQEEDSPYIRG